MTTPPLHLPALPKPKIVSRRATASDSALARFDAVIVLHNVKGALVNSSLPSAKTLDAVATRSGNSQLVSITLPNKLASTMIAARVAPDAETFDLDSTCRPAAVAAVKSGAERIAVVIDRDTISDHAAVVRSAVATLTIASYQLPKFTGKRKPKSATPQITVFEPAKTSVSATVASARGNCLARWLTAAPANLLDAKGYRTVAETLANQYGWQYQFHSLAKLKRQGAGAFVAVAQGNDNNDAGIIQIRHRQKGAKRRVALVGKGIIFDTGGTNLKPHGGMLNMHIDMGGSAVALASLLALTEMAAPLDIDVWLAVSENRTGPLAFKPQDVVTSLSGKTIQTIHTDAEGRMVLADTLTMAGRAKPDAIIDFATLTGASVTAVTTRYSSIFSNRPALHPVLKRAGQAAGERVWPFPIGGDFLSLLDSETADIMQCTAAGGGDHILAATFLNEFVPTSVPWVHVDLSSCENKGGLGAVDTAITGFGVRFATTLLQDYASDLFKAKRRS
ncbi:MAG: leucyl aminopeptidase family protein [Pseudomonadota bacterium]